VSPSALTAFLTVVILAWRILVIFRDAHEASRRWSIRTALPWSLLLLGIDVTAIVVLLSVPVSLGDVVGGVAGSAAARETPDNNVTELAAAVAISALARGLPLRRSAKWTSLRQFVMAQIAQATYDKADDWIYRVVYPAIDGQQMRPFVQAIRGYLESQPQSTQGSLDTSYVANLIRDGRTPSKEDLRAACHRMLARGGRKRLAELVDHVRGSAAAHGRGGPIKKVSGGRPGAVESGPTSPPATAVVRGESGSTKGEEATLRTIEAGTTVGIAVYVEAPDEEIARRVVAAVEAVIRMVGDTGHE
jgi:hypothetical protein